MLNSKSASSVLWSLAYPDREGGSGSVQMFLVPVLLVNLIVLGTTGMFCMNLGLMNSDAARFVPLYFAVSTLGQLLTGAIFFDEFSAMESASQCVSYAFGVSVVLLGAYLLTSLGYHELSQEDLEKPAGSGPFPPLLTEDISEESLSASHPKPSPSGRKIGI